MAEIAMVQSQAGDRQHRRLEVLLKSLRSLRWQGTGSVGLGLFNKTATPEGSE